MEEEASVDQSDRYASNNHETILYFSEKPEGPRLNMLDSRSVVRYNSCQDQGPSLKIMMATLLLFQNVVIPACRQTPDRPSTMLESSWQNGDVFVRRYT